MRWSRPIAPAAASRGSAYGPDGREGVGDSNRADLPAGAAARLAPERSRRSTTACARRHPRASPTSAAGRAGPRSRSRSAYPGVRVDGFDRDEESHRARARATPSASGVADRVSFEAGMRGEPAKPARTTWSRSSSACTTCPVRSRLARGHATMLTGRRRGARRRRAHQRRVHRRAGRVRTLSLRVEPLRVPAGGDDRARFGGYRHGDASVDAPGRTRARRDSPASTSCRSRTIRSGCTCSGPEAPPATLRSSAVRRSSHRGTGRSIGRAGHPM